MGGCTATLPLVTNPPQALWKAIYRCFSNLKHSAALFRVRFQAGPSQKQTSAGPQRLQRSSFIFATGLPFSLGACGLRNSSLRICFFGISTSQLVRPLVISERPEPFPTAARLPFPPTHSVGLVGLVLSVRLRLEPWALVYDTGSALTVSTTAHTPFLVASHGYHRRLKHPESYYHRFRWYRVFVKDGRCEGNK